MCPIQLAEVKVRLLEAKQTLEECISTQDFSRAAKLKDSITELENRRDQILQEMETSSQGADKEVRGEKVHDNGRNVSSASDGWKFTKRFFFSQNDPETLLRCLTMCAELLKQMSMKTRTGPTISALMSSLV